MAGRTLLCRINLGVVVTVVTTRARLTIALSLETRVIVIGTWWTLLPVEVSAGRTIVSLWTFEG